MEKRPRLRNDNQGCHGERMENMSEGKKKLTEEDKEQVKYLKEWAAKRPKDNKQGWVAHLFQRFMKGE